MRTPRAIIPDEPQPKVELDDEDREALDEAIEAARSGKLLPLDAVRAWLRTL